MTLRLGVDLDGTLADLSGLYRAYETRLFGEASETAIDAEDNPEQAPTDKQRLRQARQASARRDAVWRALRDTPDLWTQLAPIEPGVVAELWDVSQRQGWEVFFITQRPSSAGSTVQLQSQQWLARHGFKLPSVLTLPGSRGKAAATLHLDFLIDDLPKNCIDVVSDSRCRPILVMREPDEQGESAALRMKVAVVRSVRQAIAQLSDSVRSSGPGFVERLFTSLRTAGRR